ncbi:Oleate hydratase [Corynebacterium ciconiae DSM 44920]|uniref:oleate hydratase n=1 Tax=Corynebacterium ciconiae TaxID=227319 RepID=UPI000368288D|nr:oleate hydratase [Corynebacterium ciconiae]WKD60698.1 Oleate hydratase [Corynebacterium ciconiae DSM 44920]
MSSTEKIYQKSFPVSPDGNPYVHNDLGRYTQNRPVPPADVAERKAYLVGSGIASLIAAAYLVRDGQMPGENITILEELAMPGGAFDGNGDTERGFIARGGREMGQHFECFWDIMKDIPALEMPEPYSVLDEFRITNENDPNKSNCRVINSGGEKVDTYKMGINKKGQLAIIRLLLAKEEDTYYKTIEDWFDQDFLDSMFYTLFKTMFAFEQWQSLTEMKRYMHRFLQYLPGFSDLSCLRFSKYNQYDSFVVPLVRWLKDRGVVFQYNTQVLDLDMEITAHRKVVTGIVTRRTEADAAAPVEADMGSVTRGGSEGAEETIPVRATDLVFVTNGSLTESTGYGDMDTAAPYHKDAEDGWVLWRNLAKKSAVFGRPDVFTADTDKTVWQSISFNFIGEDHPFLRRIKELSGNDPLSGTTVTGGIITVQDSSWCISLTMNRQPQFHGQPKDWGVAWAYGLYPLKKGDTTDKTMLECTGEELLKEYCYHFGLMDQFEEIKARTKVRIATMPYVTAFFMPRGKGDRPEVIPEGCVNLAFLGQFAETPDDCIFTTEGSARTAMMGVYGLLDLDKDIPPIWPAQYDIRALLASAKTMNNGTLPGGKVLRRFLKNTYYEDILP